MLLVGQPGSARRNLAVALRREAILAGHSVQFVAATTVVANSNQRVQGSSPCAPTNEIKRMAIFAAWFRPGRRPLIPDR